MIRVPGAAKDRDCKSSRRNARATAGLLAAAAALAMSMASWSARADFVSTMKAYEAKDFATAQAGFRELAELGDGASQFNLGAMALRGEGVEKSLGEAAGWLRAAQQNGYSPDPNALAQLEKKLTPEQRSAADAIVARYGRDALLAAALPSPKKECPQWEPGSPLNPAPAEYPDLAVQSGQDGVVVLAFTVGVDGLARDPQVLAAQPREVFDVSASNAMFRSRYKPSRSAGEPVPSRLTYRYAYSLSGRGMSWDMPAFQSLKSAADVGHPRAQYLVGAAASLDPALGIAEDKAQQMILSAAQGGDPQAQYWIATEFGRNAPCEQTDKSGVWLEHSARGGERAAQVDLARRLIRAGSPADIERGRQLLASITDTRDFYVLKHAVALATGVAGFEFRDPELAASLARQLDATPRSLDPQRDEALAAAFALEGDFAKAGKAQSRALSLAAKLKWNTSLIEERLASYQAKQSWKGDLFNVPPATDLPAPEG